MGNYDKIRVFLTYLIQRIIFQRLFRISIIQLIYGRFVFSVYPILAKDLKFTLISKLEAL